MYIWNPAEGMTASFCPTCMVCNPVQQVDYLEHKIMAVYGRDVQEQPQVYKSNLGNSI